MKIKNLETFRNEIKNLQKSDLVELSDLLKSTLNKTWNVYHNTNHDEVEKLQIEIDIIECLNAKLEIVDRLIKEKDLIKVKAFKDNSDNYKIIDCYNPIDIIIISKFKSKY